MNRRKFLATAVSGVGVTVVGCTEDADEGRDNPEIIEEFSTEFSTEFEARENQQIIIEVTRQENRGETEILVSGTESDELVINEVIEGKGEITANAVATETYELVAKPEEETYMIVHIY